MSSETAYGRHKDRAKLRSAAITLAGQDIGAIPPVRDHARRARGDRDFRFFCENYFPHLFDLAWSNDHLRVIAKIQRVVLAHETLAIAMPRGSGKTTLCQVAVIWAVLSGRHKFVMLIAATEEDASAMIGNIKSHLSSNELLLGDYPEAIYPIRKLESESRRCAGQRYYGRPTNIGWSVDEIIVPSIPGSPSAGAIIRVRGITGTIRGALYARSDGTQVRPSLVVCDDPQTDESAKSPTQTAHRLAIINGAIMGLAGPGLRTAVIIPCTVIQAGDMADRLLDRQENPQWHGERTKMIYSFPSNARQWGEYNRLKQESQRADGDGREATVFYAARRARCGASLSEQRACAHCPHAGECMDAGAVIAWPDRFVKGKGEVSALQHAMNLKLDVGEAAFLAEYQNEPLNQDLGEQDQLDASAIIERTNGRRRGELPTRTAHLTMFADVHDKVLFWMVCAWQNDFTGCIVDYGTYPDQRRWHFTLRDAKATLGRSHPGAGREAAIQAGLKQLTDEMLAREWTRDDGTIMQIGRCLIDAGYVPEMVFSTIRRSGRLATLMPSKGVGIGPDGKPFSEYIRKAGEQYGQHWRMPSTRGTRELATVNIDTNFWKTFIYDRLTTGQGDPGSLTLFGSDGEQIHHRLLSEHLCSEFRVRTIGRKRTVDVWKVRPGTVDNHWFDCLVGCAVAASMLGCSLPGTDPAPARSRNTPRLRLSALQRSVS